MKHTPGPWFVKDDFDVYAPREYICTTSGNAKANASFIVTACNSHEELLNALKQAKEHLEYCNYGDNWEKECAYREKLPEKIEKAIAKAEGKD